MTCFRGAKVYNKWLRQHTVWQQVHNWTKSENSVSGYACVVTLHDTDTNDDMTSNTDFHTEHINTNTWVYVPCLVLVSAHRHTLHMHRMAQVRAVSVTSSHPRALMMCAVLPRHWSLHYPHLLPHAPPVALLPLLPPLEVRRQQPAHSAQRENGFVWRDLPPHSIVKSSACQITSTRCKSSSTAFPGRRRERQRKGKARVGCTLARLAPDFVVGTSNNDSEVQQGSRLTRTSIRTVATWSDAWCSQCTAGATRSWHASFRRFFHGPRWTAIQTPTGHAQQQHSTVWLRQSRWVWSTDESYLRTGYEPNAYDICKGNEPCTSYSRTFTIHNYGYGTAYTFTHNNITLEHTAMNDKNTNTHTDAYNTQFWARCAPPVDAQCSRLVCVIHVIHACAPVSCVLIVFSSPFSFSTSSHCSSSSPSWCLPQCPTRGPGQTPCATPAWGAWSHPTTSHPSQVMSPSRTWTSRTLKSSTSRPPAISTSRTPWATSLLTPTIPTSTTMSLRNSLQLWSIEQGNLLR